MALSLGAFALSMVALSSAAEPATMSDTTTAAATSTTAANAGASTGAAATATATAAKAPAPASTSAKPMQMASKPAPTMPLNKQTFTVVEAVGVNIALKSGIDVHKSVTLKKGQMLVLKSQNGTMIEVDGPYSGKPLDHYTNISDNATMGYDAKSFAPKGHCSGVGAPHPAGGPNPDETGGAELQATHCQ
ncbi:MAG TPA: hypothetical protein VMD53_05760 [Rhizomicrobium sp.]|nr:hypothetical protein [Rhizomicrobium sp.]